MTAIFYKDCEATSPNGKYILEARSPHNGTINHRDGSIPSDDEFPFKYREHQCDFRYQLINNDTSLDSSRSTKGSRSVIWERWQERDEDSPHEVLVSDEGWSILRTHGFRPEIIAVSPEGKDVIRVTIGGPNDETDADSNETDQKSDHGNNHLWRAALISHTTAGHFWTEHSWRYFLNLDMVNYLAWRASWGQHLVIDLTNATLIGEMELQGSPLGFAMREKEIQEASILLSDLASQTTEIQQLLDRRKEEVGHNQLLEKLKYATAAIHLAAVHQVAGCVPFLRRLEEIECLSYSTTSTAMGRNGDVEAQYFRPIVQHSLRLLDEQPRGYVAYHFSKGEKRFPLSENVPGRRERNASLDPTMDAEQVLRLLGSPDHVRQKWHAAEELYRWTEDWDYDFRVDEQWVTLQITWEETDGDGRITRFEEAPSYWLDSNQREAEILRH